MARRLTDATHYPGLRSWVASANEAGCDFPIQNLPLGRFRPRVEHDEEPQPWRFGVAIGNQLLDLKLAAAQCPWPEEIYPLLEPLAAGDLPAFMAMQRAAWKTLRLALSDALAEGSDQGPFLEMCLLPLTEAQMALPCTVGDYTDFYVGIHHARAVGAMFRPDNPLLPNYQWLPIGYHGRASSVQLGGSFKRPRGQTRSSADGPPSFGPSRRLDYELELGIWIGLDNPLGEPVAMVDAEDHIFGFTLLNDWSARDLQGWEYQPLGPFLSKNFFTSVSPWLISLEALAPFRRPFVRPEGDPHPLPHLDSDFNRQYGQIDITLQAWLQTRRMQLAALPPVQLSQSSLLDAYWTPAQLIAHHTSNGCNLQRGDLLGTGTISGPREGQGGSLLELSAGGKKALQLPGGETRTFLEDGDTLILKAFCEAPGAARIGLGQLAGKVLPAK
jgi:fumarylacetoacetase